MDNFYLTERLLGEEAAGRASVGPGLFYRFRFGSQIEFVAIDSSRRFMLFGDRFFRHPNHQPFLEAAFPAAAPDGAALAHSVRASPALLRGAAAGQLRSSIEQLVPLFERSGVRVDAQRPRAQLPALAR